MSARSDKADKLQSTVIISDRFTERRAQIAARHDEPANNPLEPGSMVGRYLTLSRVGVGGMGVVYRAHDTELNRTVALKVLPSRICQRPDFLNRFRTEAQAQARLNSPYVITLYELMVHPVGEILVLEYVEGETLENRLRRQGPLPLPEAVRIFEQTLRGIEHIHQMGVIHRDLKPSNIFITRDGQVKLMDFGIARLMDNQDASQKGIMVGTLLYISPEQINGRVTDCRSDVYTLGISLFEAVTGRLPFERRSDYALMHAHVQENPPSPMDYQRRLEPELEWVILKAIEKEPNRRFQTASEFLSALLELGIVERRHAPSVNTLVDKDYAWRRRAGKSRRFGRGTWLDFSLVAMALVLVAMFDIIPVQQSSILSTTAKFMRMDKTTTPKPVAVVKKELNTPAVKHKTRAVKVKRADKYASLRDAWGS